MAVNKGNWQYVRGYWHTKHGAERTAKEIFRCALPTTTGDLVVALCILNPEELEWAISQYGIDNWPTMVV